MIKNVGSIPGRVAGQTGCAVVRIAVYSLVFFVRFRIGMAVRTGHFGIVGRIAVTIGALIPFTLMISAVDREVLGIVIEIGGCPGCFIVATGAIGRKLCRNVVRVGGIVVIIGMAARTGIRGIVVVPVVTRCTVIRNACMRSIQRVVAVVIGEGCRLPGCVRMACGTICGNIEGNVVRIGCLVVIVGMAPGAVVRSIGVISVVTCRAVRSNSRVRTRERVVRIVIKGGGGPGCLRMTRCTVGWKLLHGMVGLLGLVVVVRVTTRTGVGRGVVVAVVAGGTIVGYGGVSPVQHIEVIVNIECRRCPGCRCMAGSAVRRQIQHQVPGI